MRDVIRPFGRVVALVATVALAAPAPVWGLQQPDDRKPDVAVRLKPSRRPAVPAESASVVPNARYRGSNVTRWLDGDAYRDLWTTTIRVPVLNLQTFAPGGIKPVKEGGGFQTKNLRFEAANGDEWVFRLVEKKPGAVPSELRSTPVEAIVQDIQSSQHPASTAMAVPIIEAAGVLHPSATLYVMPNDPALGKFRAEFAGQLGDLERFPKVPKDAKEGWAGASKIIDSPELLKLINEEPKEHVDAHAFLIARLADFLINDNDRHAGQWKWARLASGPKTQWEPIARDRDHAFVAYDGLIASVSRMMKANVVRFTGKPDVSGLTFPNDIDRRLLAGLEKPVWDSIAHDLQRRVTDSVIHATAMAMPVEYRSTAPALEALLKQRRANLPAAADEYYRHLAERVHVDGTDSSDCATIVRSADGSVDVRLESGGTTFYSRRFRPGETREVMVYLHNGDDTAVVTGHADESILVRVIGGNGNNVFVDSSTVDGRAHPTHFYDAGLTTGVSYGMDTLFVRLPWERRDGLLRPPLPDYGAGVVPHVGLNDPRTLGLTPLLGFTRYTYGFQDRPYSSMLSVDGEYATQFRGARLSLLTDKRFESSPLHVGAFARVSDLQYVNFFGFGNATTDTLHPSSFFDVHQRQWTVSPVVGYSFGQWTDVTLGPMFQHASTDSASSPFLGMTHPYGFGTFNEGALQFAALYNRQPPRVDSITPSDRYLAVARAAVYPAMMDVQSTFGKATVGLAASLQLPVPTAPTLTFRAGGTKLWGNFPFFDAATIGGDHTTQFIDAQRYAGDASLYGTTQLLVPVVTRFRFVIPARAGIVGDAEGGRVYLNGSSPGGWHSTLGAGVWVGRVFGPQTISLIETRGEKHGLQLRLGLDF